MADPTTTNFGWDKPVVGASADTWGASLNANLDAQDATLGALLSATGNRITPGGVAASAAAWTTNAIRAKFAGATYTDTTSSGTVPAVYVDAHKAPTLAASSAETITNAYTIYCENPVAGTNVTLINAWALGADSLKVNGNVAISSSGTVTAPDSATWSSSGIRSLTSFVVGASAVGPAGWLNQITSNGSVASHLAFKDTSPANGDAIIGFFDNSNVTRGSIAWNGTTAVQYNTTSDERLKDWSVSQHDYRGAIEAIWVGDFIWKEDGAASFGIRAQQVHPHFPHAVRLPKGDGDNWQADYSRLAPLALWGVKDLYRQIGELTARVERLELERRGRS